MASSDNSDEGGHGIFTGFSGSNGSTNEYDDHSLQLEYLKVVNQLKTISSDKQRLERDVHNLRKELENGKGEMFNTYHGYNALKQKYDNLRLRFEELTIDPTRCGRCEEISKERNDYKKLLKEAECEIATLLSERDSVLKENQKLHDKNENLKREMDTALSIREEQSKEFMLLREKLELMKSRTEFKQLIANNEQTNWSKELSESKDKFAIAQENLDAANQEIDRLKKQLEKSRAEVIKAIQETEICKGRRDWAITEREKIVHERDSVRNLCDEIRKERDTATSKLLAAIRDKDEAFKEIEQLHEHLELQINRSTAQQLQRQYLPPPLELLDQLQQYDTEVIQIDTSQIMTSNTGSGIILGGDDDNENNINGNNNNNTNSNSGIYVIAIEPDSIFSGKLKVKDIIVQINNMDCTTFSKRTIFKAIHSSIPKCILTVKRPRPSTKRLCSIQLNTNNQTNIANRNHGLTLDTGFYITKIESNSVAAKNSKLSVGDRVLSINNKSIDSIMTSNDVNKYLNDLRNNNQNIQIVIVKDVIEINRPINRQFINNKMHNSSTQTENYNNYNNNNNNNNNNNRLSLEFDNNNHFLPATQYNNNLMHSPNSSAAATTVTPAMATTGTAIVQQNSKSGKSKVTEMIQKLRDKMHNIGNHKDNQENDEAIAVLDSVLDISEQDLSSMSALKKDGSSSGNVLKRSKRNNSNNKNKDSSVTQDMSKNVGTWPRTNMIAHDTSYTGTIVHHRKKERPRLYLRPDTDSTDINTGIDDPSIITNNYVAQQLLQQQQQQQQQQHHQNSSINVTTSQMSNNKQNRHSNPIPAFLSKFVVDQSNQQKTKSVYSRSSTYETSLFGNSNGNNVNLNRLSLNPATLNKVQHHPQYQQNSLDFMPIKNHHQMDSSSAISYTSNKSIILPNTTNSLTQNYAIKSPSGKDALDFYVSPKISKSLSKYSSDNDSLEQDTQSMGSNNISTLPTHLRKQSSMGSGGNTTHHNSTTSTNRSNISPFAMHSHYQPLPHYTRRHQSPSTTMPLNDILGIPVDNQSHMTTHHHHQSVDYPISRHNRLQTSKEEVPSIYSHAYEGGTFPRKKENQRFRIPSNQSVTSKGSGIKISNGSIDYCGGSSERASPMPTFHVQVLNKGLVSSIDKRNSLPDYNERSIPNKGEVRQVHIDKSEVPLGIKIRCRGGGGVFVSNVGDKSIAKQVGLTIGDQLLEVCGINMRSATYELAANVLRQIGNSITMLVQYSPDKYDDLSTSDENLSHSGSPTPQNSPHLTRSLISTDAMQQHVQQHIQTSTQQQQKQSSPQQRDLQSSTQTISQRSILSSQLQQSSKEFNDNLLLDSHSSSQSSPNSLYKEQPRVLYIETRKCPNLGISLLGGNAYGIYVHSVQKESIADNVGLRVGDQILEYNSSDLRRATAEHAAFELAKPADKVTVLVQYNIQKFNLIKDKPGDSLYIRVSFDRSTDLGDSELSFVKDDVLYIDNTMFRGVPGHWRAWKLDEYGHRLECGIIPSQMKVEEELRLLGDLQDGDTQTRRGSTSTRRSFFKRIKPQRSSSRDSKELASFSNTHLSLYSESSALNDDSGVSSYVRVERLEYKCRPVLVLGPLAECVVDKLTIDFPEQFKRCIVNQMRCSKETMENGLQTNTIVDYRRRGSIFECTTIQAIKEHKNSHCIIDIYVSSLERLHRNQIYPIVLLLRFKSAKQIKEIKDSRISTDKISAKVAKEMYEHALKLESDYRQYISVVIPAGVNIMHMSTQIKAAVDAEQQKILWVPTNS